MKKFHLTKRYTIINFDAINFSSQAQILSSKEFALVLKNFLKSLEAKKSLILNDFNGVSITDLIDFFKTLLVYDLNDALNQNNSITTNHVKPLYLLTEALYDYWREIERFGILKGSKNYDPNLKIPDLVSYNEKFNETIITLYRTISQKLLQANFHVYRQLPARTNANLLYIRHRFTTNKEYENIQNIPFVTKVLTNPPFIINSKSNTRSGLFTEITYNPLKQIKINKSHYFAFPVMVGPLLAFVYTHRDFLHQAIALSNLFEFADYNSFKTRKPDLIYLYGIKENEFDLKYYFDHLNKTVLGFVSRLDKNDYFGYLKKMLLTLHNVYMINEGKLPIHGAMVEITLNDNTQKNIVIIGDSGAGKSETLEALRVVGKKQIRAMRVVFDDMGIMKFENNQVVANGTEIGAFIRLDDLDTGYAYQIMDRALFLNPNQINARVVIPITSHEFISKNHPVDMVFYANNYSKNKNGIKLFSNLAEALEVFKKGVRKAKGTTSEVGLVSSYFANPFGPVQEKEKTEELLIKYFKTLQENNVLLGEIYTKLAVDGYQTKGPQETAKQILTYLEEK